MVDRNIPPGWSYNPSAWSERWPVLLLGLTGLGIAIYLTLFQVDVLSTVWEPFFGSGSVEILKHSAVVRILRPVPDAALGAFAYLLDVLCDGYGGADRWRRKPWVVLSLGLIAAALGFFGIVLAMLQPFLVGNYCTLCLGSAACSVLMVGAVMDEVLASLQHLIREHESGRTWWQALMGSRPEPA